MLSVVTMITYLDIMMSVMFSLENALYGSISCLIVLVEVEVHWVVLFLYIETAMADLVKNILRHLTNVTFLC